MCFEDETVEIDQLQLMQSGFVYMSTISNCTTWLLTHQF